jgi:DNA replication protein DnaC
MSSEGGVWCDRFRVGSGVRVGDFRYGGEGEETRRSNGACCGAVRLTSEAYLVSWECTEDRGEKTNIALRREHYREEEMIGRIRRRIFQVLDGRGLTDDQKRIYHAVTDGIDSGRYREMTIAGYAGTGKTYVTGRIAETLRKCGHSVIAAGTTHKAAREIAGAIGAKDGKTIHHLLGLRVQRDGKGDTPPHKRDRFG